MAGGAGRGRAARQGGATRINGGRGRAYAGSGASPRCGAWVGRTTRGVYLMSCWTRYRLLRSAENLTPPRERFVAKSMR